MAFNARRPHSMVSMFDTAQKLDGSDGWPHLIQLHNLVNLLAWPCEHLIAMFRKVSLNQIVELRVPDAWAVHACREEGAPWGRQHCCRAKGLKGCVQAGLTREQVVDKPRNSGTSSKMNLGRFMSRRARMSTSCSLISGALRFRLPAMTSTDFRAPQPKVIVVLLAELLLDSLYSTVIFFGNDLQP